MDVPCPSDRFASIAITIKEADVDRFRGFVALFVLFVIDTVVARPAINGSHSVQFRPICS